MKIIFATWAGGTGTEDKDNIPTEYIQEIKEFFNIDINIDINKKEFPQ